MILGHGIDIVSVDRIEQMIEKWGDSFLKKIYALSEIAYCKKRKNASLHFASRFAAKEAFAKALGTGITGGIRLSEIETVRTPSGMPVVRLKGKTSKIAKKRGIRKIILSLSDEEDYAIASVILER